MADRDDARAAPRADPRVATIFSAALARTTAARDAFVREACAGDADLAHEVAALLAAHAGAGEFLEPAPPVAAAPPAFAHDRYRLIREIGHGGMASVWLAEQREPVERTVALKVMEYRLHGAESQRRFNVERQAIARMDHPLIAQIFDAGTTADGRPYLAMEYVPGVAITAFCEARALSLAGRLRLMVSVCHAVHHAHTKGVVHRDLKPSNVLVVEQDGRPLPKLIDFGIAKASSPDGERATATAQGELLGTLEYMSPEQAAGGAASVDARTDVYSLGSIVYELVAGELPLAIVAAREQGFGRALAAIERDDPRVPSIALGARARAESDRRRRAELLAQSRIVRGDLDGVLMKALEKQPHRRYATARDLADDLERFLAHEPVAAVPPGRLDRARKWVARNRAASIGIAGVFLTLVAGLAVAISMYHEVARQSARVVESDGRVRAQLAGAQSFASRITEFTDRELANLAGGVGARVLLAEWAVEEQERVAEAGRPDPANTPDLGYAYQRRGEAYAAAGRARAALASFEQSLAVRARAAPPGASSDRRRALGVGHWRVSDGLRLVGDPVNALVHDRTALAIMEALVAERAFDAVGDAVYLSIGHRRVADGLLAGGDAVAALDLYTRCLDEAAAGFAVAPDHGPLHECRTLALRGRAAAELALGRNEQAAATLRDALELLAARMAKAGATAVFPRIERARLSSDLAHALVAQKRADEAQDAAERALAGAAALVEDDPDHFEAREVLANARVARAAAELAREHTPEAGVDLAAGRAELEELARRDPDRASIGRELAAVEALRKE